MATARYTFSTTDMVSYPIGVYVMQITAISGMNSASYQITLNFVDPCLTVDLGIQPSPFSDLTYVLSYPDMA